MKRLLLIHRGPFILSVCVELGLFPYGVTVTQLVLSESFKVRILVWKQKVKNKNKIVKSIYELSTRTVTKIFKRLGLGCSNCGWIEGTCDIHHINGRKVLDCDNHNNLSLLCPNCHRLVHENKIKTDEIKTLVETLPYNWQDSYYG